MSSLPGRLQPLAPSTRAGDLAEENPESSPQNILSQEAPCPCVAAGPTLTPGPGRPPLSQGLPAAPAPPRCPPPQPWGPLASAEAPPAVVVPFPQRSREGGGRAWPRRLSPLRSAWVQPRTGHRAGSVRSGPPPKERKHSRDTPCTQGPASAAGLGAGLGAVPDDPPALAALGGSVGSGSGCPQCQHGHREGDGHSTEGWWPEGGQEQRLGQEIMGLGSQREMGLQEELCYQQGEQSSAPCHGNHRALHARSLRAGSAGRGRDRQRSDLGLSPSPASHQNNPLVLRLSLAPASGELSPPGGTQDRKSSRETCHFLLGCSSVQPATTAGWARLGRAGTADG